MRLIKLAIALGTATAALAVSAGSAQAYTHTWSCSAGSAAKCYDTSGSLLNSWTYVAALTQYNRDQVCAKGETSSGNVRTGSGSGCNFGTTSRQSFFSGGSPTTWAYVYWAGNGGTIAIAGDASTTR